MFIMKAKAHDLENILLLQKRAYESEAKLYDDYNIPPMTQTIDELVKEAANSIILKAEINEKIVGSIRAEEDEGIAYIKRLVVDPDYQGKGIGTTLLLEIEKYVPSVSILELFTGIKSYKNIKLYEKHGYLEHRRQRATDRITFVYFRKDRSLINA